MLLIARKMESTRKYPEIDLNNFFYTSIPNHCVWHFDSHLLLPHLRIENRSLHLLAAPTIDRFYVAAYAHYLQ